MKRFLYTLPLALAAGAVSLGRSFGLSPWQIGLIGGLTGAVFAGLIAWLQVRRRPLEETLREQGISEKRIAEIKEMMAAEAARDKSRDKRTKDTIRLLDNHASPQP